MSSGGGGVFNFDLGELFSGLGAEQVGTVECGSRPSCFTTGKVCTRKLDAYDDCVRMNIGGLNRQRSAQAQGQMEMAKNIGKAIGLGAVALILFVILRR